MKNILVTGGAGFIGSHLCERLILDGQRVIAVDNFITGNKSNLNKLLANKRFTLIEADVSNPTNDYLDSKIKIDEIYHLASPASPQGYIENPVETYQVNSFATHHLAEYARKNKTKLIFASTSEVYGDPLEHPQKERYWGNVNPIGIRSCYDVSKRFGEMVLTTFIRKYKIDARIVRIFNTYGPRMDLLDGRVVPNFVTQALKGESITVHGDGTQTRSFCYVSDLVEYLVRMSKADISKVSAKPINIGNDQEFTVLDFAQKINKLVGRTSKIIFIDRPEDDPNRRRPDLTLAKRVLKFSPKVGVDDGLKKTIAYYQKVLQ